MNGGRHAPEQLEAALLLGDPSFADAESAALARDAGPEAAWRLRMRRGARHAVEGVTGNFAVALRDDRGRVFMAVDRFAVHSLCFRIVGGHLRFAARADVLADNSGGEPASIEPQAILDYLYFHAIPSPRTIFEGVHRLPPGHCAWFEDGRLTVQPYWTAAFAPAAGDDFAALRSEFRTGLRNAVARQLDGSKPACFLSGGTDSSTVAGMIREASGRRPATYSIGFDAQGYDEMAYARIAARHFDTEHHEYYVTPDDLVRGIPEVAAHYDQPFGNSSALPAFYCARMARDDGVTRILAGDGGDELFGGNTRYAKQRIFNWYQAAPAVVRSALLEPLSRHQRLRRAPGLRKVASYVEQASLPLPLRLESYNLLLRMDVSRVLTPAMRARVDIDGPARQQAAVWQEPDAATLLDRHLAFDWRYTLAESDLPKVVGTSRLAGVEVRFPMLDAALVDLSLRLPPSYKLRGLKLRWFFKEALRGFLPDAILTKKKQGFGLPFGVWTTQHAGLRALARDALGSLGTRGIVQPAFLDALIETHLAEHPGYYGEMVWIMMMLEHWLRAHAPAYRLDTA